MVSIREGFSTAQTGLRKRDWISRRPGRMCMMQVWPLQIRQAAGLVIPSGEAQADTSMRIPSTGAGWGRIRSQILRPDIISRTETALRSLPFLRSRKPFIFIKTCLKTPVLQTPLPGDSRRWCRALWEERQLC